jgi:hypothetical protein
VNRLIEDGVNRLASCNHGGNRSDCGKELANLIASHLTREALALAKTE